MTTAAESSSALYRTLFMALSSSHMDQSIALLLFESVDVLYI